MADSLQVGETFGPLTMVVSAERVRAYADASGDRNPIHIDPQFAATTAFGGPIAHGMLLLAYLSRLLSDRFGAAWPASGDLDARFRAPARVGATVSVQGSVTAIEEEGGLRRVRCRLTCADEVGATLVSATASLILGA